MKKTLITYASGIVLAGALLAGCSSSSPATTPAPTSPGASPAATVPGVTPTAKPAPSGVVLPVTSNPITNTATAPGLSVDAVQLEDNVDASGAAIKDRMQVTIGNATALPVTDLEIYYTMTDTVTGATESYYQALTGLTIAPMSKATVDFDDGTEPGHYPQNQFSIYRSSTNAVDVTAEVSTPGLKPADGTGTKSANTGEVPD